MQSRVSVWPGTMDWIAAELAASLMVGGTEMNWPIFGKLMFFSYFAQSAENFCLLHQPNFWLHSSNFRCVVFQRKADSVDGLVRWLESSDRTVQLKWTLNRKSHFLTLQLCAQLCAANEFPLEKPFNQDWLGAADLAMKNCGFIKLGREDFLRWTHNCWRIQNTQQHVQLSRSHWICGQASITENIE